MADVSIEYNVRYGPLLWETVDIVNSSKMMLADAPVVLYLHGGGFVACNSDVMLHSFSIPIARAGAKSFSMNYPLAPDEQFPSALISTMRALAWVKKRTGANSVVLAGDSAGGCIASSAAAILGSPKLLKQLAEECGVGLESWDIPAISHLISIYGVLDREGWRAEPDPVTGIKPIMRWNDKIGASVLHFCLRCYGAYDNLFLGGRCILSDFSLDDLKNFPDTLLICGSSDPLIFGNRQAYSRIKCE